MYSRDSVRNEMSTNRFSDRYLPRNIEVLSASATGPRIVSADLGDSRVGM